MSKDTPSRRPRFAARAATLALVAATLGTLSGHGAEAAGTYRVVGTGGAGVTVRTSPNASAGAIKVLGEGTSHFLECQVEGQYVTAPNGVRSHIWNRVEGGYATDLFWDTPNVDRFSMSACGTPPPSQTREQKAVAWAQSMQGSTDYYWLCDKFVANAYGRGASGYETAWVHATSLTNRGLMHAGDRNVPFGALAFFRPASINGNAGHDMISEGNGSFITGGLSTVRRVGLSESSFGPYYGWAWADPEWSGR